MGYELEMTSYLNDEPLVEEIEDGSKKIIARKIERIVARPILQSFWERRKNEPQGC